MASTTSGVTELLDTFLSSTPPNASTTTYKRRGGYDDDSSSDVFMWMPLIFVMVFSMFIIGMIVLSRFSFKCNSCCHSRRESEQQNYWGESRGLFLLFFLILLPLLWQKVNRADELIIIIIIIRHLIRRRNMSIKSLQRRSRVGEPSLSVGFYLSCQFKFWFLWNLVRMISGQDAAQLRSRFWMFA